MALITINAKVVIPLNVTVDVMPHDEPDMTQIYYKDWSGFVKNIIKGKAVETISNGNIDTSNIIISECDYNNLID